MSSKVSTTRPLYCGELARLSDVSADTVRFYERRNLLLPATRTSAGYRVFSPDSLARMRMIRAGLSIGFSVTELADIFSERNSGGEPCHRVRKLAAEKLAVLEERLRELQSWRRELRSHLQRGTGCLPRPLAANRLDCWKTSRLTRRPMHDIWAAAFKNGESYEADSSNRTHTGSFWSTKPEAGIAERVSYARNAYSDE